MKDWIILFLFLLIGGVGGSSVREDKLNLDSERLQESVFHGSGVRYHAYRRGKERFPNNKKMQDYHAERILSGWGYY